MKKFSAFLIMIILFTATMADANPKISFTIYKCLACDKLFQSFPGDKLDAKELKKENDQLKRVFTFSNRSKNFPECKKFKYHIFEYKGTNTTGLSALTSSSFADNVAVIRDTGVLSGINLTEWECVYCKKHFYSINEENLNIRDWERQTDYLYNLKGQAIPKCTKEGVLGHIFYPKTTGSVKSYELSTIVYDLYWVKN